MERQGVLVDAGRLTDVNLLKRHVLKRCAYGVDLNPMAVELAKVSLWLDCFTIGAPLSFLDHHLKCGNSLIGTTVQEVEAELAEQAKGHVADLFGGQFQGLLAGTSGMLDIARSPDATVGQAEFSRSRFGDVEKNLAPYKSVLDIWVSRHFGNKRAQEYLTLAGPDLMDQIRSGGRCLPRNSREAIHTAAEISREKRFFHWDLEFPEAFVDLGHGRWKPKERQGFDAVVGNPPYHRIQGIESTIKQYFITSYLSATGKFDLSVVFVERGYQFLETTGRLGLIIPNKPLTADYGRGFRKMIADQKALAQVVDFQHFLVFPEASIYTCLLFLSGVPAEASAVRIALKGQPATADLREIATLELSEKPWSLGAKTKIKAATAYHNLGQACTAIFQGLISGADKLFIGRPYDENAVLDEQRFPAERGIIRPLLKGRDIRRFRIQESGEYVIYPYENQTGKTKLMSEYDLEQRYPDTYAYLLRNRSALTSRGSENMHYPAWYALWNPRQIERFESPKLVTQVLANRATFAIDATGEYWFVGGGNAGVYGIVPRSDLEVDMWFLLGYLNSMFFDRHVKSISSRFRGGFYSYAKRFIQGAPVRINGFSSQERDVVARVAFLVRCAYDQPSLESSIWPEVDSLITDLHGE